MSATSSTEQNYTLPGNLTLQHASKIAIVEDKPIMLDYWSSSLEQNVIIGVRDNQEKLLVKSEDETAVFAANSKYKLGLGFGYRWLILNAAIVSPFSNRYNNDLGKTYAVDIQMNIYAPRFQTDLRVQWIDGYYKKTQDQIYLNFENKSPYEIRNDLKLRSFGGGLSYTFNKNYLHKHGFDQTKTMKRSGGTLLAGMRLGYLKVFTDSILFKEPSNISIQEFVSIYGGFSFGGAYTFLLKAISPLVDQTANNEKRCMNKSRSCSAE